MLQKIQNYLHEATDGAIQTKKEILLGIIVLILAIALILSLIARSALV